MLLRMEQAFFDSEGNFSYKIPFINFDQPVPKLNNLNRKLLQGLFPAIEETILGYMLFYEGNNHISMIKDFRKVNCSHLTVLSLSIKSNIIANNPLGDL